MPARVAETEFQKLIFYSNIVKIMTEVQLIASQQMLKIFQKYQLYRKLLLDFSFS